MKILAKQRLQADAWWNTEPEYEDEYDEAFSKYIKTNNLGRLYDDEFLEESISYYGNSKPMWLFRGMHFESKNSFDNFVNGLKSGYLKTVRPTAWTKSKRVAEDFSASRKFYDIGYLAGDREYLQKYLNRELDRGADLVLVTQIGANKGLDLDASGHSYEGEVLLPAGKYKVRWYQHKTLEDTLAEAPDPIEVLKLAERHKFDLVFNYYQEHGLEPEDLDDNLKHKVFLYTYNYRITSDRKFGISEDEKYLTSVTGKNLRSIIAKPYFRLIVNKETLRWFNKKDQDLIHKTVKTEFNKFLLYVLDYLKERPWEEDNRYDREDYYNKVFGGLVWTFDVHSYLDEYGSKSIFRNIEREVEKLKNELEAKDAIRVFKSAEEAARMYQYLNSPGTIKRLESIADPKKRYEAFENYKESLLNAIQQLSNKY